MYPTLRRLAQQQRTPLIKFLGKRSSPRPPPSSSSAFPSEEDEANPPPHPHPASPTHDLPSSFAAYRSNAQQHGPLARQSQSQSQPESQTEPSSPSASSSPPPAHSTIPSNRAYGAIGGHSGHSLGSVAPEKEGMVMDRTELPRRFWGLGWTEEEIEGVELGGANLKVGWGGA